MREATAAKHRADVTFNPSAQSLQHSVSLVWPQLDKCRSLKKKFHLLEGLLVGCGQAGVGCQLTLLCMTVSPSCLMETSNRGETPRGLLVQVNVAEHLHLTTVHAFHLMYMLPCFAAKPQGGAQDPLHRP